MFTLNSDYPISDVIPYSTGFFKLLHYAKGDNGISNVSYKVYDEDVGVAARLEITFTVDIPSGYSIFTPSWFIKNGKQQGGIWPMAHIASTAKLMQTLEENTANEYHYLFADYDLRNPQYEPFLEVKEFNATTGEVTLVGYCYKITHTRNNTTDSWTALTTPQFFPFDPSTASTSAKFGVSVHLVDNTVGIEQFDKKLGFEIYPNPVSENLILKIDNPNGNNLNYFIYDLNGKLVKANNFGALYGSRIETINVTDLTAGIYCVKLESKGQFETKRFIKE